MIKVTRYEPSRNMHRFYTLHPSGSVFTFGEVCPSRRLFGTASCWSRLPAITQLFCVAWCWPDRECPCHGLKC